MAVVQVRLREHRRSKNEAIRRNASAFIGENGGPGVQLRHRQGKSR
jgi:hypothetical protein